MKEKWQLDDEIAKEIAEAQWGPLTGPSQIAAVALGIKHGRELADAQWATEYSLTVIGTSGGKHKNLTAPLVPEKLRECMVAWRNATSTPRPTHPDFLFGEDEAKD